MAVVWLRKWCLKQPRQDKSPCHSLSIVGAANRVVWICYNYLETSWQIPQQCRHLGLGFPPQSPSQLPHWSATAPIFRVYLSSLSSPASDCFAKRSGFIAVSSLPPPPIPSVSFYLLRRKRSIKKDFQLFDLRICSWIQRFGRSVIYRLWSLEQCWRPPGWLPLLQAPAERAGLHAIVLVTLHHFSPYIANCCCFYFRSALRLFFFLKDPKLLFKKMF